MPMEGFAWIEKCHRLVNEIKARKKVRPRDVEQVLIPGWDYSVVGNYKKVEQLGACRLPHPALYAGIEIQNPKLQPLLGEAMSLRALASGLYEQCRIPPEDSTCEEIGDGSRYDVAEEEFFEPTRAWLYRVIIGHTPHELAIFQISELQRNIEVGRLLLAKDFKGALALDPSLQKRQWPPEVIASWNPENEIGGALLPPFFALVAFAEFARLTMNDWALINLTYRDDGKELTRKGFRDDLNDLEHASSTVRRLLQMAPYQTTALLGAKPGNQCDLAAHALAEFALWPRDVLAKDPPFRDMGSAAQCAIAESRSRQDFRKRFSGKMPKRGRPGDKPKRKTGTVVQERQAATYWGLSRQLHLATGILEIFNEVSEWAQKFGDTKCLTAKFRTEAILARAMRLLTVVLLEGVHDKAAREAEGVIRSSKGTSNTTELADRESANGWENDVMDDIAQTEGAGTSLLKKAKSCLSQRPGQSQLGYAGRYLPRHWLTSESMELAWHLKAQQDAMTWMPPAPLGLLCGVREDAPPVKITNSFEATWCSLHYSTMVTELGTDSSRYLASLLKTDAAESND